MSGRMISLSVTIKMMLMQMRILNIGKNIFEVGLHLKILYNVL